VKIIQCDREDNPAIVVLYPGDEPIYIKGIDQALAVSYGIVRQLSLYVRVQDGITGEGYGSIIPVRDGEALCEALRAVDTSDQ